MLFLRLTYLSVHSCPLVRKDLKYSNFLTAWACKLSGSSRTCEQLHATVIFGGKGLHSDFFPLAVGTMDDATGARDAVGVSYLGKVR